MWARASSRCRAYFSAVTTSHLVTVALFGDLVVALEDERLDGLEVEDAVELGVQLLDHVVELHPLLRCHELVVQPCSSPFATAPSHSPLAIRSAAPAVALDPCARTQAWAPICTASHGLPSGGV